MAKKKAKKKKTKRKAAPKKQPRTNGNSGRNPKGQFAKGNKLGKGSLGNTNVLARELKKALTSAITEKDMKEIVKGLVTKAKTGDVSAAKEIFDRLWGRSPQSVEMSGAGGKPIPVQIVDFKDIDGSK